MTISLSLKLHLWLGAFITVHLFPFNDNLLTQNHSYKLFISVFEFFLNNMLISECDKYRDASSAKESIFIFVASGISIT